jgi:hypothetical protein
MATLNEIFSKLNVNVEINSAREIYKKELFTGLNENDLKKARRKLRKIAFAFASEVVLSKTEKSINEFIDFYQQVYAINDYSVSSVCSENTRNEKRDTYANCLQICKDYLQKSNNQEQKQQTTKRTNKNK